RMCATTTAVVRIPVSTSPRLLLAFRSSRHEQRTWIPHLGRWPREAGPVAGEGTGDTSVALCRLTHSLSVRIAHRVGTYADLARQVVVASRGPRSARPTGLEAGATARRPVLPHGGRCYGTEAGVTGRCYPYSADCGLVGGMSPRTGRVVVQ